VPVERHRGAGESTTRRAHPATCCETRRTSRRRLGGAVMLTCRQPRKEGSGLLGRKDGSARDKPQVKRCDMPKTRTIAFLWRRQQALSTITTAPWLKPNRAVRGSMRTTSTPSAKSIWVSTRSGSIRSGQMELPMRISSLPRARPTMVALGPHRPHLRQTAMIAAFRRNSPLASAIFQTACRLR
jgi:hypothetical protein